MEGDAFQDALAEGVRISIHTLRMEGDAPTKLESYKAHISIHTLRMEGDNVCYIYDEVII